MRESEVVQCSWLEDLQHSIGTLKEEAGGAEGQPGAREGEKIQNGQMGDKRFGDEGGVRVLH